MPRHLVCICRPWLQSASSTSLGRGATRKGSGGHRTGFVGGHAAKRIRLHSGRHFPEVRRSLSSLNRCTSHIMCKVCHPRLPVVTTQQPHHLGEQPSQHTMRFVSAMKVPGKLALKCALEPQSAAARKLVQAWEVLALWPPVRTADIA